MTPAKIPEGSPTARDDMAGLVAEAREYAIEAAASGCGLTEAPAQFFDAVALALTTSRSREAGEVVTDEMVERALVAFDGDKAALHPAHDCQCNACRAVAMGRALTAALTLQEEKT